MRIKINKYNINLNKRIILISDLHYRYKKDIKRLNILKEQIAELNPNYICIPGDIINTKDIKDEEILVNWFKELSNISKVIVSIGNHEFKTKTLYIYNNKLKELLKNIDNVYLLDNENIILDNINFYGLTLPINYYLNNKSKTIFDEYFKIKIEKGKYNILLCHSPLNIVNSDLKNIDLVLSGHMHRGLVPFFLHSKLKGKGFVDPLHRLFPKENCCYGLKKVNKTNVIISGGINLMNNIFRNLFTSEIVVID